LYCLSFTMFFGLLKII